MSKNEISTKNCRSDSASFYLTVRSCDNLEYPDDSELMGGSGWTFTDVRSKSVLTPQDIVVCHGLSHLKTLLEEIDDTTCFHPGLPVPSTFFEAQSDIPPWKDLSERFLYELLGHSSELDFVFPEQRSLVCFEVEVQKQSPEKAWKKLCSIDPSLKEVGYLQTTYPISYADHSQPGYRYRFYCIAEDGSDLRGYKTAFMVKSNILYPFSFDLEADGYSYIKQWIRPENLSADCPIYGQEYLATYGKTEAILKSGSLLDTHALEDATEQEFSLFDKNITRIFERKSSPRVRCRSDSR